MALSDRFKNESRDINSPALKHMDGDALKSDTNQLPEVCREIYIGTGGNLKVTDTAKSTVTYKNLASGAILYGFWTQIHATGSTASDLVLGV